MAKRPKIPETPLSTLLNKAKKTAPAISAIHIQEAKLDATISTPLATVDNDNPFDIPDLIPTVSNQEGIPTIRNQDGKVMQLVLADTIELNKHMVDRLQENRRQPTVSVLKSAQAYADAAAREMASKAGWLVKRILTDMEVMMVRVASLIPEAEPRHLSLLTNAYQGAASEMRRALGLREDVQDANSRALVQIQCVGTVQVSPADPGAHTQSELTLPDVDAIV